MRIIEITIADGSFKCFVPLCPEEVKCRIKENGEISYTIYGRTDFDNGHKPILNFKKYLDRLAVSMIFTSFDGLIAPLNKQKMYVLDALPDVITLKEGNKKIISVETMGEEDSVKNFYKIVEDALKSKFKLNSIRFDKEI